MDNLYNVIPLAHMDFEERLNSVVRFSLYYSIAIWAIRQNPNIFVIPALTALATYIAHKGWSKRKEDFSTRLDEDSCTPPTDDNPFMNVLAHEYNSERPEACDPLDEDIKADMDMRFKKGVYLDQDDIYNRNSGSRQFYTNPVTTTVADQGAFADWLYGAVNCSGKQVRPPPQI